MSDDALHDAAVRGSRAESLLNDELLQDSFKKLEDAYIAAWRVTNVEDTSSREKLFLAVNIIGKVRDHLGKVAANGTLAKAEIDELVAAAEHKKRFNIFGR